MRKKQKSGPLNDPLFIFLSRIPGRFPVLAEWLSTARSPVLQFAHGLLVLFHRGDQDFLEFLLAGTCRDCMSADDILLQAFEVVDAASDGCLAEHLGGLLE